MYSLKMVEKNLTEESFQDKYSVILKFILKSQALTQFHW